MYVAFHKEQQTIIESHADHGYSNIVNGTKVCNFLHGIKSTELDTVVNFVHIQLEMSKF